MDDWVSRLGISILPRNLSIYQSQNNVGLEIDSFITVDVKIIWERRNATKGYTTILEPRCFIGALAHSIVRHEMVFGSTKSHDFLKLYGRCAIVHPTTSQIGLFN